MYFILFDVVVDLAKVSNEEKLNICRKYYLGEYIMLFVTA